MRILILEPESERRKQASEFFGTQGHEVVPFADTTEVLDCIKKSPVFDGIVVSCQELRAETVVELLKSVRGRSQGQKTRIVLCDEAFPLGFPRMLRSFGPAILNEPYTHEQIAYHLGARAEA